MPLIAPFAQVTRSTNRSTPAEVHAVPEQRAVVGGRSGRYAFHFRVAEAGARESLAGWDVSV